MDTCKNILMSNHFKIIIIVPAVVDYLSNNHIVLYMGTCIGHVMSIAQAGPCNDNM